MNPHSNMRFRLMTKNNSIINLMWLLLCEIGLGIFMIGMPKIHDDWWFMYHLKSWFDLQPDATPFSGGDIIRYGIPWQEFRDTIVDHYHNDNMRISNYFAMFLLIFPKWVGSSVAALSWMYVMWGSLKLVGIDWRKTSLIPIAIFLWIFGLPWRDYLGCMMFQFNYVVASALCIWLLNLIKESRHSPLTEIRLLLLGLLVGAWHEGFSAVMIVGLTALLLFTKNINRRNIYFALAGLCIGFVWLLFCPNFFVRADLEFSKNSKPLSTRLIKGIFWHFPSITFLLTVVLYWWKSGWQKLIANPIIVFLTAGVITSVAMFMYIDSARSGWMGDVMAIPGIIYMLDKFSPSLWKTYRGWSLLIGIVLMTGSVWTLVLVDKYTLKYKPIYEDMIIKYGRGEGIHFFVDILPDDARPYVVSLFVNNKYIYDSEWFEFNYYRKENKLQNHWIMIPRQLEKFDFESAEKIPGNAGFRRIDGLVVGRLNPNSEGNLGINGLDYYNIDFGPVKKQRTGTYLYRFTNSEDGKEYVLAAIFEGRLQKSLFGITRIDTISE